MARITKISTLFWLALFLFACKANNNKSTENTWGKPKFVVQPEIYNFGTLESGEVSYFSFKIKNEGDGKLQIDSIDAGCGCIKTEWNNKPVKQGEYCFLKVIFNSSGEWGNVYKPITLYANGEVKEIFITAKVENTLFN